MTYKLIARMSREKRLFIFFVDCSNPMLLMMDLRGYELLIKQTIRCKADICLLFSWNSADEASSYYFHTNWSLS